jgi:hypothetical protein
MDSFTSQGRALHFNLFMLLVYPVYIKRIYVAIPYAAVELNILSLLFLSQKVNKRQAKNIFYAPHRKATAFTYAYTQSLLTLKPCFLVSPLLSSHFWQAYARSEVLTEYKGNLGIGK